MARSWPPLWGDSKGGPGRAHNSHLSKCQRLGMVEDSPAHPPVATGAGRHGRRAGRAGDHSLWRPQFTASSPLWALQVTLCLALPCVPSTANTALWQCSDAFRFWLWHLVKKADSVTAN